MNRPLGFFSILALGINTIVGAGIFRLPSELQRDLGSRSYLAFGAGAVLLGAVALCFAEVASRFEVDGGAYVYAKEAFGIPTGFAVGFSAWIACVLTLATVAAAIPGQLAGLTPIGAEHERALGATSILVLGVVALFGIRPAAWLSNALVVAKILPLILLVVVGAFATSQPATVAPMAPVAPTSSFGAALLVVFFALSGFESSAVPGGCAASARRTIPLALLGSLFGAAILYAALQWLASHLVPNLESSERPLADLGRVLFGARAGSAFALVGALSMLGLCAAMIVTGPLFLRALIRDDLLPRWLDFAGQSGTLVLTSLSAALLALLLDFRHLVDCTAVVLIVQYLSTCAAVPVLRRRGRAPLCLPFGMTFPLLGSVLLLWVLWQSAWQELALGAIVMAAGLVMSRAYRSRIARAA